ncbi:2-oxoadipate dehydrogenase complex component E1-like [Ylistrum balloti]|uniref:2-oxoadipate dehydrogenase complex component E1-like n=1 Tax=Ylistrum balloti TaxID=509963 RepID=UPI0029057EFB|nr:2-oxoadipate dehydrogenase complex component E1-like [Ylistrum balloti]
MLLPKLRCLFTVGRLNPAVTACYHSQKGVYGYKPLKKHDSTQVSQNVISNRAQNANVYRLVEAYRKYGHRQAMLDPLRLQTVEDVPELCPSKYGLSVDSQDSFSTEGILCTDQGTMTLSQMVKFLDKEYCGPIAAEFDHLETEEERNWFAEAFESKRNKEFSPDQKISLATLMLRCQAFDHFLANKFTTVKRYGGEGGESMMGMFKEIFQKSSESGVSDIVICMPHRGRLNFLTCMLQFPPVIMYQKMKGMTELPPGAVGTGDVLSHLYTSTDLEYGSNNVHVSLIPNPSHLEANNPVAAGKVRAKQQTLREGDYCDEEGTSPGDKVLCLQVHGDASFSAQGVVAETFAFAECPHFRVGGSVHLIINNQVGFTTEAERGRSSRYCSDLAKMNGYPVLHVNADSPEDVMRATTIAMDYRNKFRKDVIIDFICFRKYGHNEIDDPSFTQPIMYRTINSRTSIPDMYANKLVDEGVCGRDVLDKAIQEWSETLAKDMSAVDTHIPQQRHLQQQWSGLVQASDSVTTWDTGVASDILKFVGAKSVDIPSDQNVHPTIQKTHVERRLQRITEGNDLDWATAEALAFGSLLYQGFNVRISGQDVGRGTFSHRHGMIVDQETDNIVIPLNHMSDHQKGYMEVANSALTEEAVLGFEYGMSLENPNNLVIWEAQFGDFFNGAQIIIDTYIASGEDKWLLQSGLVMLLPHGMDGAGPEHSSCRMERFLQMCDSSEHKVDSDQVNLQVANPTTSAQYFHLLRRQMVRNYRKPLVVVAPKVLLRLSAATSSLSDMTPGTSFKPVLGDPGVKGDKVAKVIFCTGKHFYNLQKERDSKNLQDTAIIRLESLCPFPTAELQAELVKFPSAKDFVWSQEEHRNMGAWTFVSPRFENLVGRKLRYVGRDHLGCPATGIGEVHRAEAQQLLLDTFS